MKPADVSPEALRQLDLCLSTEVIRTGEAIVAAMDELHRLFIPEARLTFVARIPGDDDATMVITADDIAEVIKVLRQRSEDGERSVTVERRASRKPGGAA